MPKEKEIPLHGGGTEVLQVHQEEAEEENVSLRMLGVFPIPHLDEANSWSDSKEKSP